MALCIGICGCGAKKAEQQPATEATTTAQATTNEGPTSETIVQTTTNQSSKTWAKYPKLIGKTYAEIKRQYGALSLAGSYYDSGGYFNQIKGRQIWIALERNGNPVSGTPSGKDVCTTAQGVLSEFFNNIESQMTKADLQKLLGINIKAYNDEAEGEQFYIKRLPDESAMYIYVNKGIATPKSHVWIQKAWEK